MAEIAVAMSPVKRVAAERELTMENVSWTAMVWAELLAFVSGDSELNDDPLLDRW